MMPSRGLQVSARTLRASQYRSQYAPRMFSTAASRPCISRPTRISPVQNSLASQRRHLSWSPASWWSSGATDGSKEFEAAHRTPSPASAPQSRTTTDPPASSVASPDSSNASSLPDASTSTSPIDVNLDSFSSLEIPQTAAIGHLKALGLDYGWGPTSMIEWSLEHMHVWTGLPWWASIALTSAAFRLAFFPLQVKMSDNSARMAAVKPYLDEKQRKMMTAYVQKDTMAMSQAQQEMSNLRLRAGISFKWMAFSVLGNMTLAICGLKLLRAMSTLPVPGLLDGGALWFTNLSIADPYYLIPAIMGTVFHFAFRFGTEPGMDMYQQPAMRTVLQYGFPALIAFSMIWFSVAVNIWLAASGVMGLATGRILLNPAFRERYNLAPMPQKGGGASPLISSMLGDKVESSSSSPGAGKTIDVKGERKFSGAQVNTPGGPMQWEAPKIINSRPSTRAPPSPSEISDLAWRLAQEHKDKPLKSALQQTTITMLQQKYGLATDQQQPTGSSSPPPPPSSPSQPRTSISSLWERAKREAASEHGLDRLPTLAEITATVNAAADKAQADGKLTSFSAMLREARSISDGGSISRSLREMQRRQRHGSASTRAGSAGDPERRGGSSSSSSSDSSNAISSLAAKARAASQASADAAGGKKGRLEKYTDWVAERANDLGETYGAVTGKLGDAVRNYRDQQGGQVESKTRSKEFIRRAEEYEKMARRQEERKKREL